MFLRGTHVLGPKEKKFRRVTIIKQFYLQICSTGHKNQIKWISVYFCRHLPIVVLTLAIFWPKNMASDPKYFRRAIVDIMMKNYCPDAVSIQQPCFLGLQTCLNFYITKMLFAPNFKKFGLATSARFQKW